MKIMKMTGQILLFMCISIACYSLFLYLFYDVSNILDDTAKYLLSSLIILNILSIGAHSKEYKMARFESKNQEDFELSAFDKSIITGRIFFPVIGGIVMTALMK